jgi:beta-galactosidase/beta-glucuronidase
MLGGAAALPLALLAPGAEAANAAGNLLAGPAGCGVPPREPVPFPLPDPGATWSAPPGRTVTTVEAEAGRFLYRVNGRPQTIQGMGYNPPSVGPMWASEHARRQRLQQDLTLMAAAGVNTLVGWNPAAIDGLALDVAWQAGLGVVLPFDVDFTADVRDTRVQQAFMDAVLTWVWRYREHPAVRMWGIGNEVLQRSVPPAWCGTPASDDQHDWAVAWSRLLLETADLIHAHDPDHPVLYREAEDSYAPWLAGALAERPADRPWLVYGINAYTPRLGEIIASWPRRGIPTSVFISEYAPLNAPHGQRAEHFRSQWQMILARPEYVLGGAVYVWATDGPEEVDRQFGLVDAAGQPVDNALAAISELYHADAGAADAGTDDASIIGTGFEAVQTPGRDRA